jgi:hypothetical protein
MKPTPSGHPISIKLRHVPFDCTTPGSFNSLFTAWHNFHQFHLSRLVHMSMLSGNTNRGAAADHPGNSGKLSFSGRNRHIVIQELFEG